MPVLLRPSIHRNLAQALTHHENFLTWPTMEVGGSMDQQLGLLATTCSYITIYNMHNIYIYVSLCIYIHIKIYIQVYILHILAQQISNIHFSESELRVGFLAGQALEATRSFLHSEAAPERDWNLLDRKCT